MAKMMHLLSCSKNHKAQNMEDCYWYLEEQTEECWSEPDHRPWLDLAKTLIQRFDGDEKKAYNSIMELSEICSKLAFTMESFKGLESFVVRSIKNVLS